MLFLVVLWAADVVHGQVSSCPNTGFEYGDLTGWTGTTGQCCPIDANIPGIITGRHTIMSGPGTDPNTGGAIPVVAPGGGMFSARLGNDSVHHEAETLSYSMLVDAGNALFVYRYAVVLEDPGHAPEDQPRFEISMFDQDSMPISCGQYEVTASAGIPGFELWYDEEGDSVIYKNWSAVSVDLSSYIGQTVTIRFATGDCALGKHFGYAYIDCYCSPLQLTSQFCPGLASTTLSAPPGFAQYLWSTGETTPDIVVTDPVEGQVLTCTLTSVAGCSITLSTLLTPSTVHAGFGHEGQCMNAVTFSDSSFALMGPPIDQWDWDFGDGTTLSGDPSPVHGFSTPGTHVVTLSVQSGGGCPDTFTDTVLVIPAPTAAFTTADICLGDSSFFDDQSLLPVPLAWREWDLDNGAGSISDPSPACLYTSAGVYTTSLLVVDQNGCRDSTDVDIQVLALPDVDLGPDRSACPGSTVHLSAFSPGSAIAWSTGQGTPSINVQPIGLVWVNVTASNGCVASDSVLVVPEPMPEPTLHDTTGCISNALLLHADNPGCTYAWSTGAHTEAIAVNGVPGLYSVVITTPAGCSLEDSAWVTFADAVVVDAGPDTAMCEGEQVMLMVSPVDGCTYVWSNGVAGTQVPVQVAGPYWVEVSNGHCAGQDTVLVVVHPAPVVDVPDQHACATDTLTLDAGNAGCTYAWGTGDSTRVIHITGIGGYIALTVTSPYGCSTDDGVLVQLAPTITLDLGDSLLRCDEASTVIDAGPFANGQYAWSEGSTSQVVTVNNSGTYWVDVTNGYCAGSDTVTVMFGPSPVVVLHDTTVCADRSVVLDASCQGCTYLWSTGATTPGIVVAQTSGPRSVTVSTTIGCTDTAVAQITFIDPIALELGADTTLCAGEEVTIAPGIADVDYHWSNGSTADHVVMDEPGSIALVVSNGYCTSTDTLRVAMVDPPEHIVTDAIDTCFEYGSVHLELAGGPDADLYQWSTGSSDRTITVYGPGTYVVASTLLPHCTVVDTIIVGEFCGPAVYIPNSFTPDGDGLNDRFYPQGHNVRDVSLLIFDRWGELIFEGGPGSIAWDGSYGGQPVQIDVYNYRYTYRPVVDAQGRLGREETLKGHVTVLR